MRTLPLTVLLIVATAFSATAQLVVEVLVEQEQFLRDEAVTVKVRVTNRSGQTLRLGADNDWLGFAIEGVDSGSVSRLAEVPVKGEFLLESAHMATRTVDLAPGFDLSLPGRYNITATVRIKEWGTETASKPRRIEVVRGTKIWEQEFGVPADSGLPETRRYVLQQANYKKQLMLFLRLTDLDDQKVFRVAPLGPLVSFSQPEAQVDRNSAAEKSGLQQGDIILFIDNRPPTPETQDLLFGKGGGDKIELKIRRSSSVGIVQKTLLVQLDPK